ncbi:MAG: PAS domain S-box protein [Desulfobacterales bacterium]
MNEKKHISPVIFVLEDDEILASLIRKKLERKGYEIILFSDETQSLAAIAEKPPDLLLLDYRLSAVTAKEFVAQLQQMVPDIPFVIMTGYGDERIAVNMMKMGARDYLVKDVHFIDMLPSVAERILQGIHTQKELEIAQKSLQDSEERYRKLFETSLDAIGILSGNPPKFNMVNPAFTDLFGYCTEEILSFSSEEMWKLVHPEDQDMVRQRIESRIAGGHPPSKYEFRIVRKDGTVRWVEVLGSLMKKDGSVSSQAIYRDITERKQTEEALRRSEERFKLALEASTHGIFDWNFQTGKAFFSSCYYRMLGYEPDEFPACQESWEKLLHPEDRDCAVGILKEYFTHGRRSHQIEFRLRTKSGEWKWILSRGKIVQRDELGQPVRFIGTHVDISARKQAEAERAALANQLRQSQKMEAVGQLAGGVAHDFNNMLFVISGYSELILEQMAAEDPLRQSMKEIMKVTERATRLVRQLLLFSRKQSMKPGLLDPNELIGNALKMLRRLIGEHIALEFHPGSAVKKIHADSGQMEQMLMNLCLNARDAMPEGGKILIETGNIHADAEFRRRHGWAGTDEFVMIGVSDTGTGIPLELQEHVFEPFFTTKEVGKGTGLGLSVVYGIVRSHEGRIDLRSEPGQGTCVSIYLPAGTQTDCAEPDEAYENIIKPPDAGVILLAEDEEAVRDMLIQTLERNGYSVIAAVNGSEAIHLYQEHQQRIDLALLDLVMPEIGGLKVLGKIKSADPELPVILMTGYSRNMLEKEMQLPSRCEMIQKPYSSKELLGKIRAMLEKNMTAPDNSNSFSIPHPSEP